MKRMGKKMTTEELGEKLVAESIENLNLVNQLPPDEVSKHLVYSITQVKLGGQLLQNSRKG